MIKFKCDFCQQRLGVPDDFIGKKVRCTKCRAVNTVPTVEEHIAKEAARSAAALPAAMKATLPSDPPVNTNALARASSLLDLSGSGSFGGGSGLLPTDSAVGMSASKVSQAEGNLPSFPAGQGAFSADDEPSEGSDASVVGLFDTGQDMSALHFSDKPAPIAADDAGRGAKSVPVKAPPPEPSPEDEDFGLGLLEDEDKEVDDKDIDLEGLGF